jgi:hypothetical protein
MTRQLEAPLPGSEPLELGAVIDFFGDPEHWRGEAQQERVPH